ncbi:hypothetical protein (plasmid) [Metabacillus dongyingensis]|nr:hypothetical protein [Metabacillus dongyingensis]
MLGRIKETGQLAVHNWNEETHEIRVVNGFNDITKPAGQ